MFRILKRLTALVLALALGLVISRAAPVLADGPITSEYFALDDGGVTSQSETRLNLARDVGATSLRLALYWRSVEPLDTAAESFNWTYTDKYFQPVLNAGLAPLVYITENPAWAANTPCGPIDTTNPALVTAFADFMGALATRYPEIKIWGLYNESDNSRVSQHTGGCFGDDVTGDVNTNGVADYVEYAEMSKIARAAVHQANPDAKVAMTIAFDDFDNITCPPGYPGGCPPLSHFNYNFLPNLFAYMAANPLPEGEAYADLLAFSYYDIYGGYWQNQPSGAGKHGIQAKVAAIRQRMTDAGVSIPLYVTETGSDSKPAGLEGQSRCLALAYVRGMAVDLKTIVWWTLVDNDTWGWYYGLLTSDNNLKPSYHAYQTVFNELNGWTYRSVWKKHNKAEGYKFVRDGQMKWVLWSNVYATDQGVPCARAREVKRVNLDAKRLTIVDLYGNARLIRDNKPGDLNPKKGRIGFLVDGSPQYVSITRFPKAK